MSVVQNLLLVYIGVLVLNAALSAALWIASRDQLHRRLFFVWGSMLVSFAAQGALAEGTLPIVLGFSTAFGVNLTLAALVSSLISMPLHARPYVFGLVGSISIAVVCEALHLRFLWVALPVALAVASPSVVVLIRAWARRRSYTVTVKALLISCFLFSLHNIDFAFLRDRPQAAPLGFTIALLIVCALSIFAPASVFEQLARREARSAVEVDAARSIQTRLLPSDEALPELEVVCHMRPASQVGGDYFDIHRTPGRQWFFVGDVTGHGLGAGLVTLMAQSIIQSILKTHPNIMPRELNTIANRALCENLLRLGEQRHMTIVSICHLSAGRFVLSGSHDNIYVYRAARREVEIVPIVHFPLGLGFLDALNDVGELGLELRDGDLLFVGTDGITEAARGGDEQKELFGELGLVAFLTELGQRPLAELKVRLIERLESFTGGVYHDDVAFMMLRTRSLA
jgi:serine phosphatase RsbU (regulator of sigma subunit)